MVKISDAEFEVMKIIWNKKEATSLEIIHELTDFKWNANTIRTLIKRLYNKGAIEVIDKTAKVFTYRAIVDEDKYKLEAAKDLIKRLYNNSINEFVEAYCQSEKTSRKKK